jgi:hypothetical protein
MDEFTKETQRFLAASTKRRGIKIPICEGYLVPREQLWQYAENESRKFDEASKIKKRTFVYKNTMMAPITHGIAPQLDHQLRPRPSEKV